ncbi:filamentous hemagglutinin N-terminal domain-containing protein [bacterium]|nr:filamentous hemagglutinin N-terminal domain-containing protein [bacterium]
MRRLTHFRSRHDLARIDLAILLGLFVSTSPIAVLANPVGGVVSGGAASIGSSGHVLTVNQATQRAVIDWRGFDIAPHETTRFVQPNTGSWTLNRVNAATPSLIQGNLIANGRIGIINPNGVVFSGTSRVDAAGLIASTANISNANFMAGNMIFDQPGNPHARIVNEGRITARQAGLVGLVAPVVENSGIIEARLGKVVLASGDGFALDMAGDGLLNVAVSRDVARQLVKNTGSITADGGSITLTAATARHAVDRLIDSSGLLRAQTVGRKNGVITLSAGERGDALAAKRNTGRVAVSGMVDASGKEPGSKGGSISILGDEVALLSGARIDASGHAGGGAISIGGEYQGGSGTYASQMTYVDKAAKISASATDHGDGGHVVIWSDGATGYYGNMDVRGGAHGGHGGFAEVSAKGLLDFQGHVDLRGPLGNTGTLLLDPTDITISYATDSPATIAGSGVSSGGLVFTGHGGNVIWTTTYRYPLYSSSILNINTLQNQLAMANVVVTTQSALSDAGDITVADVIAWNSPYSLTLRADRNIAINAPITNLGTGDLILKAGLNGNGDITIADNLTITLGGGRLSLVEYAYTAPYTTTITSNRAAGIITDSSLNPYGNNISLIAAPSASPPPQPTPQPVVHPFVPPRVTPLAMPSISTSIAMPAKTQAPNLNLGPGFPAGSITSPQEAAFYSTPMDGPFDFKPFSHLNESLFGMRRKID